MSCRRVGFAHADIDACDFAAGHALEVQQVGSMINNGDVHGAFDRVCFGPACLGGDLGGCEGKACGAGDDGGARHLVGLTDGL